MPKKYNIPLARPFLTSAEIDAVTAVLKTPNLSLGPKVTDFESAFANYCGTKHAVSCSSGTSALQMIVRAMGIGPGHEVITTPFSFVASSNCILMEGATPVFVDIDPNTWNIDPAKIETAITPKTKAILPVDTFGPAADMTDICNIAEKHNLLVIEDSCEALGTTLNGKKAGSLGTTGAFGFYPNKQITTGEGGMIVTDNDNIADVCRSLRNQGRGTSGGWLAHERMGYNFRMSDINAAIGQVQLARIDEIIAERNRVHTLYTQQLANEKRLVLQQVRGDQNVSWFVFVVRLADNYSPNDRNRILSALIEMGIGCSNYFAPIHLQPFYAEQFGYKKGLFPICEAVAERTIALPFHHELTEQDVSAICNELSALL